MAALEGSWLILGECRLLNFVTVCQPTQSPGPFYGGVTVAKKRRAAKKKAAKKGAKKGGRKKGAKKKGTKKKARRKVKRKTKKA